MLILIHSEQKRNTDFYEKRREKILLMKTREATRITEELEINRAELAGILEKKGPKVKKEVSLEEELKEIEALTNSSAQDKTQDKTKAQKKAEKKADKIEKAKAKSGKDNKEAEDDAPSKAELDKEMAEDDETKKIEAMIEKNISKYKRSVFTSQKRKIRITNISMEKFFLEYEAVNNPDAITDLD